MNLIRVIFALLALTNFQIAFAQNGNLSDGESEWSASEYSGSRTTKDYQAAMLSKGFSWLSGSPADNEKLSIGKNAQFFGFVALRYQSGRAANRGALGRAFFSVSNDAQRNILSQSVLDEEASLQAWWVARESILQVYEDHLYTGQPINETELKNLGAEFSKLGAQVAVHEALGFSALEDSLNDKQRESIREWREGPELTQQNARSVRVSAEALEPSQYKQLEDLFAKAFSWITGTEADNEIIPLGQPAQFFGFVSIRHKSGQGANRGQIARSFHEILNNEQAALINSAVEKQIPVVTQFLQQRHLFLQQLSLLRKDPKSFDEVEVMELAESMGHLEVEAGLIEARAYRAIRETMSESQIAEMMGLRGNYILDENEIESQTWAERGQQLSNLCFSCHGHPGQSRSNVVAPSLDDIFNRPIASVEGFEYSNALTKLDVSGRWTPDMMDQFITSPKAFAPGTKMEFQGLLNAEDRKALVDYLLQL